VDDRRRALLGDPLGQAPVHLVDQGQLARSRLLPLPAPAPQRARHVVLLAAEVAEPHRVRVDRVDRRQGVDDALADRPALGLVEGPLRVLPGAQHWPLDELHDVERGAVHLLVRAEPRDRSDRHRRARERRDHAVLAAHVVGGAETLAERRPAQDPAGAARVGHRVGEVGVAARDPLEPQRRLGGRDLAPEPGLDPRPVDSLRRREVPIAASLLLSHGCEH